MNKTASIVLFWAMLGLPAFAQHADVEIEIEGNSLVVEQRIAEGEFGENPLEPSVADEPGFEVDDGIFSANQPLSFDVSAIRFGEVARSLWFWDGNAPVDFGASSHDLVIRHPLVADLSVRLDSQDGASEVAGFQFANADPEGGIHQDLEFALVDAAGEPLSTPSAGVYLFGMEMASDGFENADPLYLLLASGVDENTHELAVDYVASSLVPEPSYGFFCLLGLLPLGRTMRLVRSRRTNG